MTKQRTYIAIDLKSFYASQECASRHLDPLKTNLVVADASRTEKTICLAVSPSLKAYGIPGRARLFEVQQAVKKINEQRLKALRGKYFTGSSSNADELREHPDYKLDFIIACPRMQEYLLTSQQIYGIYLNYAAATDIHVYSIDEVFIDATSYLSSANMTPYALARKMIFDVLQATGITATAGIGTNLYLAKVAMDIVAKHIPGDSYGVRIASLNESCYRRQLWAHEPITDFWRVGHGIAARLAALNIHTMGDLAAYSLKDEETLYKIFGVNAELLIDHAWGWEPVRIADIKAYHPEVKSLSQGQVLLKPYTHEKGLLIIKEMADLLALDLVKKHLMTREVGLYVGFDRTSSEDDAIEDHPGGMAMDYYGRRIPAGAHAGLRLENWTSSSEELTRAFVKIYEAIADPAMYVRRVYLSAGNVIDEKKAEAYGEVGRFDLFSDADALDQKIQKERSRRQRETKAQKAILEIQQKYGKNSIVKAMDLEEDAMTIKRNRQIGGHHA